MKIDSVSIRQGLLDGQYVWVCDFRYDTYDYSKKPLRHVKPQRVLVRANDAPGAPVGGFKYSLSHFVVLKPDGAETSKTLGLSDNTGYRQLSGTPLSVFDNELECQECYLEMSRVAQQGISAQKDRQVAQFDKKINEAFAQSAETALRVRRLKDEE